MRNATLADIDALAALELRCNPSPWHANQLQHALMPPNQIWICTTDNARISAMLVWQQIVDEAEIHLMDTHPDNRRQGLASQLLQALYHHAQAHGLSRILLEVRAGNDAALALYQHQGFVECGRRRGYYTNGEDAILMEKTC